jgi:hypothetical protein
MEKDMGEERRVGEKKGRLSLSVSEEQVALRLVSRYATIPFKPEVLASQLFPR